MFYLFIYSIVVYALANMLVYFNGPFGIIDKIRTKLSNLHPSINELFSCMFCMPTNIGIIFSVLALICNYHFTPATCMFKANLYTIPLIILFDALYAGGITYLIHTLQNSLEQEGNNNRDNNGILLD